METDPRKLELYGGDGGEEQDMDPMGISRIVEIAICHSKVIDAITVSFERFGTTQCTSKWGGGGGQGTVIKFKTKEYITSVKGTYDKHQITSLVLKTNLKVYEQFGTQEGNTFKIHAPHSQIIGFHGRSGMHLNAIGVYVRVFPKKPVRWWGCSGRGKDMDFTGVTNNGNINTHHSDDKEVHSICSNSEGRTELISLAGGNIETPTEVTETDNQSDGLRTVQQDRSGSFRTPCSWQSNHRLPWMFRSETAPIIKKDLHGGHGGYAKDMDPRGITRFVKIAICHDKAIRGLTVSFERNGTMECTERWGLNHTEQDSEINFETNEYITSLKGTIGICGNFEVVRSLVLKTNLRIYGPYGTEEGKSFEILPPHGRIVALHARSDVLLDAIGVHIQGFTKKLVLCGGDGGSAKDMDIKGVTRIVQVTIRHGDAIDAISLCFNRKGRTEGTPFWGGNTGALTDRINLEEDEYITSMRGYIGYLSDLFIVRSLEFTTNKLDTANKLTSYGPYGKREGVPFELSAHGGQIIGFYGRSGAYLHAIGVYVWWPE